MHGSKIREIRQSKNLTLNEIAERTKLTASYLSQIERNIIDPSISSLRKISMALEVPIYTFLTSEDKQHVLIKANECRKLALPNSEIQYEFISPMAGETGKIGNARMEVIYFKLEPKGWSNEDFVIHAADECIFVVSGTIEIYLDKEKFTLEEGDSIYITENVPHRMFNPGEIDAVGISNISPPIY
jgi:transcriptional regulator with XRE-family HTH domain